MEALERLLAIRECELLTSRYCRYVDDGFASRIADLFTEDGVFEIPGMRLEGREEIRRVFAVREAAEGLRTVHLATGIEVNLLSQTRAEGRVTICLFRATLAGDSLPVKDTAPAVVGWYHDSYELVAGDWLIASRRQEVAFATGADPGWIPPLR